MKKLSWKELQNSQYEKIRNYFCKENVGFFHSNTLKIKAYDTKNKIIFLDNIRFESEDIVGNREYYIKCFDKKEDKIEVLFNTINEKLAIEQFKKIIKGSDICEN